MKKTIAMFCVAAGLSGILSVHAAPSDDGPTKSEKTKKTAAVSTKAKSSSAVHYITSVTVTGSHIPVVVSSYNGRLSTESMVSVFEAGQLANTGQLTVAGELIQRDPAISLGAARH